MTRITTLHIDKESHKFSAAHYTIFSATERERLHGHNYSVSARIVAPMGDNGFAAKAAALAGIRTMMEPRNMVEGRLSAADANQFLATHRVDFVLIRSSERAAFATQSFALSRVENCPLSLYRPIV